MTQIEPTTLRRRDFLRAAALLAGATTLGLETYGHAAPATDKAARPATSLAFWDGVRFRSPVASAEDHTQRLSEAGARITLYGHHRPNPSARATLRAVIAHFAVPMNGRIEDVPFHAWASIPHHDSHQSVFTMPVDRTRGLHFTAALDTGAERHILDGPSLRAGTYLLAVGGPNLSGCRLDTARRVVVRRTLSGPQPVAFEYLLLKVVSV